MRAKEELPECQLQQQYLSSEENGNYYKLIID